MTSTATQAYLDRDTPVTEVLRPYVAGDTEWEPTRDALIGLDWADVPHGSTEQLMGRDDGDYVAGLAPGDLPVPGSWDEFLAAADHHLITAEQVGEVLSALNRKDTDG